MKHILHYLLNQKNLENVFYFSFGDKISVNQLIEQSILVFHQFKEIKIPPQKNVILKGSNDKNFIVSLLALWFNENIVLPLEESVDEDYEKFIKEDFKPIYTIKPKEKIIKKESPEEEIIKFARKEERNQFIQKEFSFDENSKALCIYTSGSTGKPKGVILNHRAVFNGALNVVSSFNINEKDKAFCVLPMSHINGLITTLITPLLSNSEVYYYQGIFDSQRALKEMIESKSTWLSAIPLHYNLLNTLDNIPKDQLKLRFCRSASAPLSPKTLKEFESKYSIPLIETMGMTETCGQIFANPLPPKQHKPSSVGKPFNFCARITDEFGKIIKDPNITGNLEVKGNSPMEEYHNDQSETEKVFHNNWLKTGDLAYRDTEGYYFLVGRKKNIAIFGGVNISLWQIENDLKNLDFIFDVSCVIRHNDYLGDQVEVFIILKDDDVEKRNAIKREIEKKLPNKKALYAINYVQNFPRTPNGKTDKVLMQEKKLLKPSFDFNEKYSVGKNIVSNTLGLPIERLTEETKFGDFKEWDSLGQVLIISRLEEITGKKLNINELEKMKSIKEIDRFFEKPKQTSTFVINYNKDREQVQRLVDDIKSVSKSELLHLIINYKFLQSYDIENIDCLVDEIMNQLALQNTVIMNCFNWDFCSGYSFSTTKTPAKTGMINEVFRRKKEVKSGNHPIYNYAAFGNKAADLLEHHSKTCWGKGSTTYKLLAQEDTTVICGGVPFPFRNAAMHSLEEIHQVSYRYFKKFAGWVEKEDEISWYETQMYVRDLELNFKSDWSPIGELLKANNKVSYTNNGLFSYLNKDVYHFGNSLLEKDKEIFFKTIE